MQYQNPILSGVHPDPSICRVGEDYFLVTSTFEYFPGIPVFHSTNLVDWELIGHCMTNPKTLPLMIGSPNASGIYAPTIRYHDGTFYVICTNVATAEMEDSRYGNFIVTTKDPYGTWSDPVWVDFPGIDPSLFWDEDGSVYCCGSNQGAYLCKINPDTGEILSKGKVVWEGTGGCCPEGPHLYKKDGWYYMMIAEGGTEYGHMETIARSRNIEGPYVAYEGNPILSNRSLGAAIMATGHADLVDDIYGNWWGICLGIRPIYYPPKHNLGRETFLFPVEWNKDGWPVCGKNGVIEERMSVNRKELPDKRSGREDAISMPVAGEVYQWQDDFSKEKISARWVSLYEPDENWGDFVKVEPGKGLLLKGRAATISDTKKSTFLGVRQEHHFCKIQTEIRTDFKEDGDEAGLSIFLNRNHHYEIAITNVNGMKQLLLRRRIGSLWKVEWAIPYQKDSVLFQIEADKEWYRFSYAKPGTGWIPAGQGEVAYLTTETGGTFTGNLFALYATGNGKECSGTSLVKWVKYEGK